MTSKSLINQGLNQLKTGDYKAALPFFDQAKRLSPQNYEALYYCGATSLLLGRFGAALDDLQSALPLNPKDPQLHDYLGRCFVSLGDADKALTHFQEASKLQPDAVTVNEDGLTVPAFRFRHDLEQLMALDEQKKLSPEARNSLAAFKSLWEKTDSSAPTVSVPRQSDDFEPISFAYRNSVNLEPGSRLPGTAVNGDLDGDALSAQYHAADPRLIVIDDFLSPAALQALRDYCAYSTMWHRDMPHGYLASTLPEGFACPLVFQISEELSTLLSSVMKDHALAYAWGFKYDSTLNGVPVHADDAVVNVNFWITDDDANNDPKTGGLIVWDKKPPEDWAYETYNTATELDAIREFLKQEGSKGIRIPHRANRVVIFDSDLFHETDQIDFKDEYFARRVNITLLYGVCRNAR